MNKYINRQFNRRGKDTLPYKYEDNKIGKTNDNIQILVFLLTEIYMAV